MTRSLARTQGVGPTLSLSDLVPHTGESLLTEHLPFLPFRVAVASWSSEFDALGAGNDTSLVRTTIDGYAMGLAKRSFQIA